MRRYFKPSNYELHELLTDCLSCDGLDMSRAGYCSYIGIVSYFSYEVRHAYQGDRLEKRRVY